MGNYATLKAAIQQVIKTNGNEEITGALLQQSLLAMIESLGAHYQYAGVADPSINPGTPDQNVFYFATTAGTYSNFGSIVLSPGEVAILKYNGNWSKDTTGFASAELARQSANNITVPLTFTGWLSIAGTLITSQDAFNTSDFIPVVPGMKLLLSGFTGATNNNINVASYNERKQFVASVFTTTGVVDRAEISVPDNVSYIRISLANNTHASYYPVLVAIIVNFIGLADLYGKISQIETLGDLIGLVDNTYHLTKASEYTGTGTPANGWAYFQGSTVSFVDNHFNVDCSTSSQNYPGFRNDLLAARISQLQKPITIRFAAKLMNSATRPFRVYLTGSLYFSFTLTEEWAIYTLPLTLEQVQQISRIQFSFIKVSMPAISGLGFSITDLAFETDGAILQRLSALENKVADEESLISSVIKGKKISIIGDSISTIYGNNNPYIEILSYDVGRSIGSWITYYDVYTSSGAATGKQIGGVTLTDAMIGTYQTFTPVSADVGKKLGVSDNYNPSDRVVWSQRLCEKTGAILLGNASWSGSRICGGGGSSAVLSEAWSDYTIGCLRKRDENGNVIAPDVVIIYRGTNDFSHTPYVRINDIPLNDGIPTTDYINDHYEFMAGCYLTIQKIRAAYPKAFIVICTTNVFKRVIYDKFPTRNGLYTLPEFNNVIRKVANNMGCGLIEFDKDGITFENCYPDYISDNATTPTHPNDNGHLVMSERAIKDLTYTLRH